MITDPELVPTSNNAPKAVTLGGSLGRKGAEGRVHGAQNTDALDFVLGRAFVPLTLPHKEAAGAVPFSHHCTRCHHIFQ